jgi:6-phosphofructokinase 1
LTLGVLTSGGDAPGMNAAIWAAARLAAVEGETLLGIRRGWAGLLEGDAVPVDPDVADRFARRGGTWLGTARLADFPSHLERVVASVRGLGLDGLFVLGGGGSLSAAGLLSRQGIAVAGVAATIDNDVAETELTIGFDTALQTAVAMADRLRDTAEAMPRLFALETLGGDTSYLAEAVARISGADLLLAREVPVDPEVAATALRAVLERRGHALMVASESYPDGAGVMAAISQLCGMRLRLTRLGHAQRGGDASPRDRALAIASAEAAVTLLGRREGGLVAVRGGRIVIDDLPTKPTLPPFPAGWRGLV